MLSRRSFITLLSAAAFVALPGLAQAFSPFQFAAAGRAHSVFLPWEVIETAAPQEMQALIGARVSLSGYLSRGKDGVFLTRMPYHCDYCYLGHARVRVRGIGPTRFSSRPVRLEGVLSLRQKPGSSSYVLLEARAG